MNKKYKSESDEIDISKIVLTIWKEKIKIILILLLFCSLGIYKNSQKSPSFNFSLDIQESQNSKFIKFIPINEILQNSNMSTRNKDKSSSVFNSYQINNKFILDKFIDEFMDFEELIIILKNTTYVQDSITGKSDKDKRQILANLAKSIVSISPKNKDESNITLNFNWHDENQFKKILDDTMKLVLLSLKKSVIEDINNLAISIEKNNLIRLEPLELQLKLFDKARNEFKLSRLQFLEEQSKIAKELDIQDNQLDYLTLLLAERSKLPLGKDVGLSDIFFSLERKAPYYLRGYKVIDKEIELIKNRDQRNQVYSSSKFIRTTEKINEINSDLSSTQLTKFIETIKNDDESKWVNYNLLYLSTRSLNNNRNTLKKYMVIGLLIATFYVLIIHVIKSTKLVRRK